MTQYYPDKQLVEVGRSAIKLFHDENAMWNPERYTISFPELERILTSKERMGQAFLEGLGLGISSAELSMSDVGTAMADLAKMSNGAIPEKNNLFFTYLTKHSGDFRWSYVAPMAFDIAKDIAQGAAKVGDKVISTGEGVLDSAVSISKNLSWIIPAVLFIAVGTYAYVYSKGTPKV